MPPKNSHQGGNRYSTNTVASILAVICLNFAFHEVQSFYFIMLKHRAYGLVKFRYKKLVVRVRKPSWLKMGYIMTTQMYRYQWFAEMGGGKLLFSREFKCF